MRKTVRLYIYEIRQRIGRREYGGGGNLIRRNNEKSVELRALPLCKTRERNISCAAYVRKRKVVKQQILSL